MTTSIRILAAASLAALAGCHALDREYLDPKVASQVTVSKTEPPPSCELVGFVKGATYTGDLGDAHGEMLRHAVLRGGNYVAVDLVERPVILGLGGYTVRGRLFACGAPASRSPMAALSAPALAAPPSAGEAAVGKACEPECASGFRCELGVCVSAPHAAGR